MHSAEGNRVVHSFLLRTIDQTLEAVLAGTVSFMRLICLYEFLFLPCARLPPPRVPFSLFRASVTVTVDGGEACDPNQFFKDEKACVAEATNPPECSAMLA